RRLPVDHRAVALLAFEEAGRGIGIGKRLAVRHGDPACTALPLEALAIAKSTQQTSAEIGVANGIDEDAATGARLDHRERTGVGRLAASYRERQLISGDRDLVRHHFHTRDRGIDRPAEEGNDAAEASRRGREPLRPEPSLPAEKFDKRFA